MERASECRDGRLKREIYPHRNESEVCGYDSASLNTAEAPAHGQHRADHKGHQQQPTGIQETSRGMRSHSENESGDCQTNHNVQAAAINGLRHHGRAAAPHRKADGGVKIGDARQSGENYRALEPGWKP